MPNFTAQITIMPLTNLLDPQGKAVHESLHKLGMQTIEDIRIGKNIVLQITADTAEEAHAIADEACKKMLYNAVMEQYTIVIV